MSSADLPAPRARRLLHTSGRRDAPREHANERPDEIRRALVVALALVVVAATFLKRSDVYLLTLFSVYLMATMGLNLTVGYAGQMSLGQAAFFGIGAYHAAILMKLGWPFLLVLPGAAHRRASRWDWRSASRRCACSTTTSRSPRWASTSWSISSCATRRSSPAARSASRAFRGRRCWASISPATSPISTSRWRRSSCSACCCGGSCARRGAARSRRCATTRSAPRASASTSRPTRCSPSPSARRARASAASTSRRWSNSSSPGRSTSRRRSRCCSRSSSAAPASSSARWSAP